MKRILLLLAMLTFLVACGGSTGEKTEGGGEGGKAKVGSSFVLNAREEPQSADPQLSTDIIGGTINDLVSEGLTKRTKDGKPGAGLAETWKKSDDGLVWTFTLRQGLKWSNGDPITANDFKAGWMRALAPETAAEYAYMLFPIKNAQEYNSGKAKAEDVGIKVVDDKTLEVTLHTPIPYFDDLVSFKTYSPLNEKFFKEAGAKYFTEPSKTISSGKYIMKEWVRGSEMVLEKNPDYWNAANIKVDKIVLKFTKDNNAAVNSFKNEEIDVTDVAVTQAKEYKNDPRLVLSDDGSVWYVLFNHKVKPLDNAKIRKAVLMAVDREELVNKILDGNGRASKTLVPAGIGINGIQKDFTEEVTTSIPGFNAEEAKKLLAEGLKEAGMDKFPELEVIFNDNGNNKLIVTYIQESLRKNLGIELKVSAMAFAERVERMKQKNFDLVLAGWSGDFKDPLTYLDLFVTNGGNNHGSYSNPKYDELIKKANTTADQSVRIPALIEAERIISEELPVGVLYHRKKPYLVSPKVKGLEFTAIGGEYFFDDISIQE